MNTNQLEYRDFLRSEFWRNLRNEKFTLNPRCEKCGSYDRLQAHHLFYRPDWYATAIDDLQTLCEKCHKRIHHKLRQLAHPPRCKKKRADRRRHNAAFWLIKPDGTREKVTYHYGKRSKKQKRRHR